MQAALAVLHCIPWPVWLDHIFYVIPSTTRFYEKFIEHKMRFDFLYNFCVTHFSL
jgi:hypothetical protein